MKALAAAGALALVLTAAPAHAVTAEAFDRVQPGWSRWHAQQTMDDDGHRTGMWATGRHRFLVKTYPADDGSTYRITFRGPLTRHPFRAPYHVYAKDVL